MRRFFRVGAVPRTLLAGKGKKTSESNLEKYNKSEELSFPDHWNEPDVRGFVYASFGRVCAYCGCKLSEAGRGDIEHFRPKARVTDDATHSGYFWLAYDFANYTLSCRVCNSSHKGDKFPLLPGKVRVVFETRGALKDEGHALFDPCADDVDMAIRVDIHSNNCDVLVNDKAAGTLKTRCEETIKFFDLSMRLLLIKERREVRDDVLEWLSKKEHDCARQAASRYKPRC